MHSDIGKHPEVIVQSLSLQTLYFWGLKRNKILLLLQINLFELQIKNKMQHWIRPLFGALFVFLLIFQIFFSLHECVLQIILNSAAIWGCASKSNTVLINGA